MKYKTLVLVSAATLVMVGCSNPFSAEPTPTPSPSPSPQDVLGIQEQIESETGIVAQLPEDGNNVALQDVSNSGSRAVVNTNDAGDVTVIADLPDTETGQQYNVWMMSTDEGTDAMKVGTLQTVKGGYVLEGSISAEGMNKVVISRDSAGATAPESVVLEGTVE